MKQKVVIIGASDFQNPLILKAKEHGYETHVFAWKNNEIGEKTADYFYDISINEKEKILEKCKEIKPCAVCSIASDLAVITVNYVAHNLGLVSNNPKYSKICTNKYKMRQALEKGNINVPKYLKTGKNLQLSKIAEFNYPLIVKPTDRSGSRGVTLINDSKEIKAAIDNAISYSYEKKAIVEEYIDGDEYSCECISYKGKHHLLAITKKYTTGAPHFIETAHIEPSGLNTEMIKTVEEEIFKALDVLHIEYGASHSEFKINNKGQIKIIEIGARMGGDCIGSDLVQISTGHDFVQYVLDVSLGKELKLKETKDNNIAFIKFIFSKEDIENYKELKKTKPELIYFENISEDIEHEIVDSSTRYGFYIIKANNIEEISSII